MGKNMIETLAETLRRHAGSSRFEDAARDVIEALRQPTPAMLAALEVNGEFDSNGHYAAFQDALEAASKG